MAAFDLMLAIAQRWKWLLGVSLLCAALAYGIGLRSPQGKVTEGPSLPSNMHPRKRAIWAFLGSLFATATLIGMQWTSAGAGPSAAQRARFSALFRFRSASKS